MFSPVPTRLTTVHELENIKQNVTYVASTTPTYGATGVGVSTGGQAYPVTITAVEPNTTINVSGNTITGYYTDAFNNEIHYRTVDDKFKTVSHWSDIVMAVADGTLSEVYYYHADPTVSKTYSYIAKANNEQQTYTIVVENNWQTGRNQLIKFTHLTRYQQKILVEWINNNKDKVGWINKLLDSVDWENNLLL